MLKLGALYQNFITLSTEKGSVSDVRILVGEHFQEIVSFANGSFMFGSNTGFGAFLCAKEVERLRVFTSVYERLRVV